MMMNEKKKALISAFFLSIPSALCFSFIASNYSIKCFKITYLKVLAFKSVLFSKIKSSLRLKLECISKLKKKVRFEMCT